LHLQAFDPFTTDASLVHAGPLTRATTDTEKRQDDLRVRVLRYALAFDDHSANRDTMHLLPPDLDVQGEFDFNQ
jgi:hypothetical protein